MMRKELLAPEIQEIYENSRRCDEFRHSQRYKELKEIGRQKAIEIFGKDYLESINYEGINCCGMISDNEFMYFYGAKTSDDLPGHHVNAKGWAVYADIRINIQTGEIISRDYLLE